MITVNASSFERFAQKCIVSVPQVIKDVEETGIGAAALLTKKSILSAAEARRWPTKGKRRVSVNYKVAGTTAIIQGTGFSGMFERGAKPHTEPGRRKAGHVINIPSVGVFAHVSHPGFKGRPFFFEGVEAAAPLVAKEFDKGLQLGLRKVFR